MPLSDVLHQDFAQQRVQRALRAGRVPHAYLFTGPDGIGKEMLATRLAAMLLCERPAEVPAPTEEAWLDACGQCEDCTLMASNNHPDFHRIYRTLNRLHPDRDVQKRKATVLGVDVIRHFLIERVGLHPGRGRAKVFLIIEADRLNNEAQNALLKTLEEPPGHSYLILIARSADSLLPTTRSRCQQIAFRTLPTEFVTQCVALRTQLPAEAARFLAELSQGSAGLALRYAELKLHERLPLVWEAVRGAAADPLSSGKALLESAKELAPALKVSQDEEDADTNAVREGQRMMLGMTAAILRDVQRAAVGHAPAALGGQAGLAELARRANAKALGNAIRTVSTAEYQIDHNVNAGLVFDAVGIEVGRALEG
jgi:DNA polymerase III subunit delta'